MATDIGQFCRDDVLNATEPRRSIIVIDDQEAAPSMLPMVVQGLAARQLRGGQLFACCVDVLASQRGKLGADLPEGCPRAQQ